MTWGELLGSLSKDKRDAFADEFARAVAWAIYGDLIIICAAFGLGLLVFTLSCFWGLI